MKNADMPATAQYYKSADEQLTIEATGLTKREHFAGLAMQAYISGKLAWTDGLDGGHSTPSEVEVAQEAVAYADALLKQLETEVNK